MQGAVTIRQCAMTSADYPDDIMYIYKLADRTNVENDASNTYGILHGENYKVPYAAKASYVQYAWYNYLTANFNECSKTYDDDCYVYKYECADKDAYMLYTSNVEEEKQIEYTFDTNVVFYDIFGNELAETDVMQNGKYVLTDVPIYAVSTENAQASEPMVSFDYNSGKFIVSGYTTNRGDMVSLTVKNSEEIIYLNQMPAEVNKYYKFSFSADERFEGELCFEFGITGEDKQIVNKTFELFIPQVAVYNSDGALIKGEDTITDGKVTVAIKVQNYISKNYSGVAICMLQRNGKLESVKEADLTSDASTVQNKFLHITDFDLQRGDRIRVFFWDKKSLNPFTTSFSCEQQG